MEIIKNRNGDELVLEVVDRLDTLTAPDLEKVVREELGGVKELVFDFSKLIYISSAGLRIIVRIKQKYDDTSLINTPSGVYDIFKMVGFHNMIKIEKL